MTPLWHDILQDALDLEHAGSPWIATLATVDETSRPRARTVILRRIDADGSAWIISSSHSDKNAHLRKAPSAELVLYLPKRREQFRILGICQINGAGNNDTLRQKFWQSISDAARATFFWPTIGRPASGCEPVVSAIPGDTPMPESFEILILAPDQVEHLTTADLPHLRTRWRRETGWQGEAINP